MFILINISDDALLVSLAQDDYDRSNYKELDPEALAPDQVRTIAIQRLVL